MQIQLRVLLRKDGEWWVVRGIEKDIAAQARDMHDAIYDFERMLMGHIFLDLRAGRQPLSDIPPAPREFLAQWEHGITAPHAPSGFTAPIPLPRVSCEMRYAAA